MTSHAEGILLIAAQRGLRRTLFDTLEHAGHRPIHSARDMAHAAILIEGLPPLQLVVLVFAGHAQDAREQCEQLARLPAAQGVPLLAVLAEEAALAPSELPDAVLDWLHAAQIERELIPRWQRASLALTPVIDKLAAAAVGHAPARPAERDEDYRCIFEETDDEWLIADAETKALLQVSPALVRNSQRPANAWLGLSLQQALACDGAHSLAVLLSQADRRWHPCERISARGSDPGRISMRPTQHAGRAALALWFRSDRADQRAEAALAMLPRLQSTREGAQATEIAGRVLFDALGLDYLAVWAARQDGGDAAALQLQFWRGEEPAWPAVLQQGSLQQVLGGRTLLHATGAQQLAAHDPLLQITALDGFAGLPLFDERHAVLGALLAGRRDGFAHIDIIEPVLRCAAARFAHGMELGLTREQGRAEGLVDALTGLPNRLLFTDRLDTILREATRNGECFAVLFLDLDRFKPVNDTYGHDAGDQVLKVAAQRLCSSIRASDTVARYAGDEFTVVLRHVVKNEDVARVAEKIVQLMETPIYLRDGTVLQVTASIGLSFYPDDASDAATLLRHADEAMYAAKHLGRNNYQVYEVSPEYARAQGTALKTRLRHAEGNGELRVVYQPQVDALTEDIVGMEALLRWEHPELGMISPAVFIPLAEETGLIVSIGEWVMRTACQQAQEWQQRYGLRLRLGVNLSAVQLMEPLMLDTVTRALRDTHLDPTLLELEITESVSIKSAPNLVENLHGLHRLGCHIAIDDFGTGAASLDYLRRLPADRIKIDQSFVRNIGVDPDDEAIVRATIEMAHRLKRAVVAEGVEIEQHREFLCGLHCDELQGYLFCRPLTPVSFDNLLNERHRLLHGTVGEPA